MKTLTYLYQRAADVVFLIVVVFGLGLWLALTEDRDETLHPE